LPIYVARPRDSGDDDSGGAADHGARERRELLPEQRLIPCLAVGPAELDLAPLTEQARKPVRGGRLGEHVVLVDVSIRARALGTEAETNVQALREREDLFLAVERKRPLLGLQFELAAEHRSLVDVRLPGEQSLGHHPPTIKLAVLNLHS